MAWHWSATINSRRHDWLLAGALLGLLPCVLLLAICVGTVDLGVYEALSSLVSRTNPSDPTLGGSAQLIVQRIRLPRALLAGLVGAMLGVCGAVTQGLFRNPLADPSLIGVTAGASLGASLMIVAAGGMLGFSDTFAGSSLISLGAFGGGLVSVLLVYRLATSAEGTSVATMLLAGIAVTALAGAVGNLLELYSADSTLRRISLWRMGGLEGANAERVTLAALVCLLVLAPLPRFSAALDAMLLGESEARYLGVPVDRVKTVLILLVAIGVGASVALAGTIAFVGLVVPHMMRLIIGPGHRVLLPVSALAGAILLIFADTLARTVVSPSELPVGIVTAIIGVPFFISLLSRRARFGMS
ncbi:MAG: FecCD family ABC transporter permease [Congregibacter sp.]